MRVSVMIIVVSILTRWAAAQEPDTITPPSSGRDTVVVPADTAFTETGVPADTAFSDTTVLSPDTAFADTGKLVIEEGVQRLKIRRRDYDYRKQLGYALGMMAFIALILTSSQSLNPD